MLFIPLKPIPILSQHSLKTYLTDSGTLTLHPLSPFYPLTFHLHRLYPKLALLLPYAMGHGALFVLRRSFLHPQTLARTSLALHALYPLTPKQLGPVYRLKLLPPRRPLWLNRLPPRLHQRMHILRALPLGRRQLALTPLPHQGLLIALLPKTLCRKRR